MLSTDTATRIRALLDDFPEPRSALLPALHIAQAEQGYLSPETMAEVGEILDIAYSDVEEVVSFYTMFYGHPVGKYVLEVCKTVPCALLGSDEIIEYLEQKLGIRANQTTPDGKFTLYRVECLAACHRAPVMQVNHRYHEHLTREKIDALLSELQ